MKIPTTEELLGVQTQFDADLFKSAYPEWTELPPDDPRKAPILEEIDRGGVFDGIIGIAFILLVFALLMLILLAK